MKILEYAASSRIGGVETYLLRLSNHLRQEGHSVHFLTRRNVPLAEAARKNEFPVQDFHRGGKLALPTLLKAVRLVKNEKIEVIHTHIFSANRVGAMVGKICNVPVVARVPATESALTYKGATHITAVSRAVKEHLIAQGMESERIRVFYNGVNLERFAELPQTSESQRKFGLSPDHWTVSVIASLTVRKGHRFLMQAVEQMPADLRPQLLFCGEGSEEANLKSLAKQLGLSVAFTGFLSDVRPVLAASDAVALPSTLEGLPNCLMEASAASLPIVATNIAGIPEVVLDGESGLLVPPQNIAALAEAVRKLVNLETRQKMGRRGRALMEKSFDDRVCLRQVEEFLVGVAQGK